tara:strand:+ start:80 stop:520 length:441 start_codon:yes stop_codon:yes gene_type:complete
MIDRIKVMTTLNLEWCKVTIGAWMSLFLLANAQAGAQDNGPTVRHFYDSNTDRIPAMTAFPKYPSIARRDRIEGQATVCFKIRANGKISRAVVTYKSHRIFSKPSLRAMRKSSFEPIGPAQILATARTCRTYRFRLDPILTAKTET